MASAGAGRFQAFMNHPAGPKTGEHLPLILVGDVWKILRN